MSDHTETLSLHTTQSMLMHTLSLVSTSSVVSQSAYTCYNKRVGLKDRQNMWPYWQQ